MPAFWGLSPRVRGNLFLVAPQRVGVGSIPACAGEPPSSRRRRPGSWVYPRVCGGTCILSLTPLLFGVYPRVCGGTTPWPHRCDPLRPEGVYPRVCGGTRCRFW